MNLDDTEEYFTLDHPPPTIVWKGFAVSEADLLEYRDIKRRAESGLTEGRNLIPDASDGEASLIEAVCARILGKKPSLWKWRSE